MDSRQTVLITGASSGFGLLSSLEFARRGFRVFATMRNLERVGELQQAAKSEALTIETLSLDVTDSDSIAAAVAHVLAAAGRIDVVVNNAGYGIGGFFEDLSDDEFRAQMETNFFGTVAVTRAVLPHMRERGRGRLVNVSSLAGRIGQPAVSAYCASKWAVEGFSEAVRLEMLPFGVQLVIVEPGTFPTPIFGTNRKLAARAQQQDSPYYPSATRIQAYVDAQIAKSTADPRRVARTIVKAATARRPRARYVVGVDARLLITGRRIMPARLLEQLVLRVAGHGPQVQLPPAQTG